MDIIHEKIDLTSKHPELYNAEHKNPVIIDVPELHYLSVTGKGHPEIDDSYDDSVKMIYGIAFTLKFGLKRNPPKGFFDYLMPPMETHRRNTEGDKKKRKRKALLLQPQYITEDMVTRAMEVAKSKHQDQSLPQVKLQKINKLTAIQTLHIGSYKKEKVTLNLLHRIAKKEGYEINGKHHEIYLNDPRRTPEEKLETIIRYQVKKVR